MKIAIIGTTDSLVDAPYNDPEWEIWGLNGAYQAAPRYDRWFDLHSLAVLKGHHDPEYFDFLRKAGDKVMLAYKINEVPEAGLFPYQELIEKYKRKYFTNTVSWLIAYAMEQNPEAIGLWGINMAMETEYATQRPSCEYLLGMAEGRGIDVIIPDSSEILKSSFLYGVEEPPAFIKKMPSKTRELHNTLSEVQNDIANGEGYMNFMAGYMKSILEATDYCREKMPAAIATLEEFHNMRGDYYKAEALRTERELKELSMRKSYMEGAKALHEYNRKNWGY